MTSTAIDGTVAPRHQRHNEIAIEHTQCVIVNPVVLCRQRYSGGSAISEAQPTCRRNTDSPWLYLLPEMSWSMRGERRSLRLATKSAATIPVNTSIV